MLFGKIAAAGALAVLGLGVGIVNPAYAAPVLEFSSASVSGFAGSDAVAGWSFTTNQVVTVVALDAYDPTGYGDVRLYDGTGTLLASATLTAGDPQEGSPTLFYSQAITPVTLAAGTTYYIAEGTENNVTDLLYDATGLSTNPAITYGGEVSSPNYSDNPTSDYFGGLGNPGWFGPNFDIAVPEPGSLALLGTGLVGLGLNRRRRQAG